MRKWPLYLTLALLPLPCYADFNMSDGEFYGIVAMLVYTLIAFIIAVSAIIAFLFRRRGSRKLHMVNCITSLPSVFLMFSWTGEDTERRLLSAVFPLALLLSILHLTLFRRPKQVAKGEQQ